MCSLIVIIIIIQSKPVSIKMESGIAQSFTEVDKVYELLLACHQPLLE